VAGFKTSRFRKPAPPAIQHVSFLFRRSYYDPTCPSFSRHRMAVMRSPGYTPLFMHENVPAPIQRTNKNSKRTPRKGSSPYFEQQRHSPEQMQCPESTANWRSRVEIRTAISLSSIVAQTIVSTTIRKLGSSQKNLCCVILLPLVENWQHICTTIYVNWLCSRLEN
jgi:hypothetical protein